MEAEEVKALDRVDELMEELGLNLSDIISLMSKRNHKALMLPDECQNDFCRLYDEIESKSISKSEKGRKLEELVSLLFVNGCLFDCRKNCRTSTNEIDLLLSWSKTARDAKITKSFPSFGESFVCECKNYVGKVGVTYVGKFISLLTNTSLKFGVIVAWEGITGRGEWYDSKGLIKKFALRTQKYVVYLDKRDLKRIYNREANVYSIMQDKLEALKHDINYDQYITAHDFQNSIE